MPKLEREYMVKELHDKFAAAGTLFVASFQKLPVNDLNNLRGKLFGAGADCIVVKNTLGRMALKQSNLDAITSLVDGQTTIAFTNNDPVAVSKVLVDFSKNHETFKIRGAFLNGETLDTGKVKELAALPPREVLLAKVLGAINAPLYGFVGVLSAMTRNLVTVLKNIAEQKEKK